MRQILIKMLKQHAIPNSSLHKQRFIHQKGAEKLVKDELYVFTYCLANTAILDIRIFNRRYHFRLWVFASTGEYFYY